MEVVAFSLGVGSVLLVWRWCLSRARRQGTALRYWLVGFLVRPLLRCWWCGTVATVQVWAGSDDQLACWGCTLLHDLPVISFDRDRV